MRRNTDIGELGGGGSTEYNRHGIQQHSNISNSIHTQKTEQLGNNSAIWTVTFQILTQCPTAGTLLSWTDKYAPLWARAVNSTSWTKGGNIKNRCVALILIISHLIEIMKCGGSDMKAALKCPFFLFL